jgi:hypothetical protein
MKTRSNLLGPKQESTIRWERGDAEACMNSVARTSRLVNCGAKGSFAAVDFAVIAVKLKIPSDLFRATQRSDFVSGSKLYATRNSLG